MFSVASTAEFDIQPHIIAFIQESPFYAEISRYIKKTPTKDITTLAIGFNNKTEDLEFGYNPDFCKNLSNKQVRNCIVHEFLHIICGHINYRRREPHSLWNISTDCAINSIIVTDPRNCKTSDPALPPSVLIPGEWPTLPDGRAPTKDEQSAASLGAIISSLPKMMSSDWYFGKIYQEAEKLGILDEITKSTVTINFGEGEGALDSHEFWDQIPEEKRAIVESKIKSIIEKAVNKADSKSDGWGSIPQELQQEIRRSISRIVDWKSVLRQFAGTLIRGKKKTSIKRINKRYPYIHPGITRGYTAKLLVAIDQSGSVDNGMLEMFFAELRNLNKNVEIDYLPFDCVALQEDIKCWPRGKIPQLVRSRAGGTDFNAPTNIANDPINRGRWDGMLIMTDGECSKPNASRIKRGWVIGKNQKLMFNTDELVICLDDGKVNHGAWR